METVSGNESAVKHSFITNGKDYFEDFPQTLSDDAWSPVQTSHSLNRERSVLGDVKLAPPMVDGPLPPLRGNAPRQTSPDAREIEFHFQQAELRDRQLADLRQFVASFLRRYAKLNPLREDVLLLRSRTKFQWSSCRDYRQFVSDAQNAFLDEASGSANPDELKRLHEHVLADHQQQNEHAKRTLAMETELADIEYDMQQKETALAKIAESMVQILNHLALPVSSTALVDEEETQPPSIAASSIDPPPLLQVYFDKEGNVSELRERIGDLDLEYQESRAIRQFQWEQERPPDVSDEEFESVYIHRRTQLEEAFAEATRVAELAKKLCWEEGIDPDTFIQPKGYDSTPAQSGVDDRSNRPATPASSGGEVRIAETVFTTALSTRPSLGSQPFPQETSAPPPLNERVRTWIQRLPWDQQSEGRTRRALSVSSPSPPPTYKLEKAKKKVVHERIPKSRRETELRKDSVDGRSSHLKVSLSDSRLDDLILEKGGTVHDILRAMKMESRDRDAREVAEQSELYG